MSNYLNLKELKSDTQQPFALSFVPGSVLYVHPYEPAEKTDEPDIWKTPDYFNESNIGVMTVCGFFDDDPTHLNVSIRSLPCAEDNVADTLHVTVKTKETALYSEFREYDGDKKISIVFAPKTVYQTFVIEPCDDAHNRSHLKSPSWIASPSIATLIHAIDVINYEHHNQIPFMH